MKKTGGSDAKRYQGPEMRVLGDQMGDKGEQRFLKGDAWIPSFEHLGRHYIITREKEPKRRNWDLGDKVTIHDQVQDALEHLGGAGNGIKYGHYIFRLQGVKSEFSTPAPSLYRRQ